MRINNYRKNGELFTATVIVFPVYDTVEPTGTETENPVLTHFATMLTHVQTLKHEEVEPIIPTSISKCGLGTSGKNNTVRPDAPYDRRQNCRKYDIEYALTPDRYVFVCMHWCACMYVCMYWCACMYGASHIHPSHHLPITYSPSILCLFQHSVHAPPVSKISVPPFVCRICCD